MERLRISNLPDGMRPFSLHADPVEPVAVEPVAVESVAAAPVAAEKKADIQQNLAQAFVINQSSIYPMYPVGEGMHRGTLFVSLDKPFVGGVICETR